MRFASWLRFPLTLVALIACSDTSGPDNPQIMGDPALGRMAFEQSCSGCHASRDGFDLKTFGFSDTTIIRRAVHHVDTTTARHIVAYIKALDAPRNDRGRRLFQPGGEPLQSDIEFANALFGRDGWPESYTTADVAAIDPRKVRIALKLPVWSDESANLDWMPEFMLPPGILDYAGGHAAAAIAGYRAAPTKENLTRAVTALKTADRATANASAPCLLEDTTRVRYRECFEVRRWTSTLVALHMLRTGSSDNLGAVHDIWWDVGNAARKSRADRSVPIANVDQNWATWMYLGWSFDPSKHSSSYLGGAFRQLGMHRQATFVALRSQVARPRNSATVYEDLFNVARFSLNSWTFNAARFALRHLNERIADGERPTTAEARAMAITQINNALTEAGKKISAADRAVLGSLAQPVLVALSY